MYANGETRQITGIARYHDKFHGIAVNIQGLAFLIEVGTPPQNDVKTDSTKTSNDNKST
jgi:hypothetical protein